MIGWCENMRSRSKKKRTPFLIILLILLIIGGTILLLAYRQPSQLKAADSFLNAVLKGGTYKDYILPELYDHPFIDFLHQENIEQYKIIKAESLDRGRSKIWVSVDLRAGTVPFSISMARYDNKWYVEELPEVMFHAHGVPTSVTEADKDIAKWSVIIGDRTTEFTASSAADIKAGQPISFYTVNDMVASVKPLETVSLSRVKSLSGTVLEDEELGCLDIQGNFPVYIQEGDSIKFKGYFALPIGAENASLYMSEDKKGLLAIMSVPFKAYDKIRVVLRDSSYSSLLHQSIEITCQEGFQVYTIPDDIQLSFDSGQVAEFRPSEDECDVLLNGGKLASSAYRWYIRSKGQKPLYVKNITRSMSRPGAGTPYHGTLEVSVLEGNLVLVNEVGMEEYLYTVVPSEMPVKFGVEALKVQAVAARSYAVKAIQDSGYRVYGAHLDDSTASQVYNNISKQDVAVHAVDETAGIVAVYNDEIVDTRFFSTSCGYTANFHEVWSGPDNEFPSGEVPYLTANPQYQGNTPDLYKEENFRGFLDNKDLPGYDRFSPFFRWSVEMTREQLEAALSRTLPALYSQQPLFVLTKAADGSYESKEITENIGTLLNIEVVRRGEGGNIMELEITTTHGVYKVIKEYNVRRALEPVNRLGNQPIKLQCHDGTVRDNFPLLPSGFAYIDFERDQEGNIKEIIIKGGGYGHGVGMSQYGTYGLTLLGKTWQEIIQHYYPGSELKNIYTE